MGYIWREQSGSVSGTFSGSAYWSEFPEGSRAESGFSGGCGFGSFEFLPYFDRDGFGNETGFGYAATINVLGASDSHSEILGDPRDNYDVGGIGSFSFSATFQLRHEDTGGDVASPSGSSTPDAPLIPGRRWYWTLKNGTTVTGTASFAGITVTAHYDVPLTGEYEVGDGANAACSLNVLAGEGRPIDLPDPPGGTIPGTFYSGSGSATISFTSALGATANGTATKTYSFSDAFGRSASGTANASGTTASVSGSGTASGAAGSASVSAYVPRPYSLNVKLPRMTADEPGTRSLTWVRSLGDVVVVSASGGAWSGSFTQERWDVSATMGGVTNSATKYTFSPVSISLTSADTVGGTAVDNAKIALLDKQISGLTLSLPSSRVLPAGVTTAIGGGGGVSRSWAGEANGRVYLMPWRYLVVRVKATGADTPFVVKLGGKTWGKDKDGNALTTGTADTYANYTIDLALPVGGFDSDGANTTYPLALEVGAVTPITAETATGQYRTGGGPTYGVLQATELRIEGSGCSLDTVTATRTGTPRLTALWPYKRWETQRPASEISEEGVSTSHYANPTLWAEVDGKPAWEECGYYWDATSGGSFGVVTWSFYSPTIAQMAGFANHVSRGGLSASIDAPASSGNTEPNLQANNDYFCRERPSWGLGGVSGWTHTNAGWAHHIEQGSGALPWQGSFRVVDFVGNIGDVLGHGSGGTTGALVLFGAHVFGASAYGLVFDSDRLPVAANVTLTQAMAVKGTGTGDSIGAYRTGSPFADGGRASHLESDAEDGGDFDYTSVTRLRQWGALLSVVFVPTKGVDNLSSPIYGYFAKTWGTEEDGGTPARIRFRRTVAGAPDAPGKYLPPVTVAEGDVGNPAIIADQSGRLRIRFEKPDGIYEAVSNDDGGTWGDAAMAIAGTVEPRLAPGLYGHMGFTLGFGIMPDADPEETKGKLKGQVVRAGSGSGGETPFLCKEKVGSSLVDLEIERGGYAVCQLFEGAARCLLTARAAGESETSDWISGDDGKTWTKLAS